MALSDIQHLGFVSMIVTLPKFAFQLFVHTLVYCSIWYWHIYLINCPGVFKSNFYPVESVGRFFFVFFFASIVPCLVLL